MPSYIPEGFGPRSRDGRSSTAYLRVLEHMSGSIAMESDLPCSKGLIRLAIVQELVESPNTEMRGQLEIAYAQLESFVSARNTGSWRISGMQACTRRKWPIPVTRRALSSRRRS